MPGMKKQRNICKFLIVSIFIAAFCVTAYLFYEHEKQQNQQIQLLYARLEEQEALLSKQKEWLAVLGQPLGKTEFSKSCTEDSFDYLAIGNSITIHEVCNYWWEEYGMAASSSEKDYYHQVVSWLKSYHKTVNADAMDYSIWEITSHDRVQTYAVLIPYLNEDIDLITLQLGENVTGLETFEDDFDELLTILAERAPKARILVIGDFWINEERNTLKNEIAQRKNLEFIDLNEIAYNPVFRSAIGAKVYDSDGNEHVIQHEGVASHPGDAGMAYIASEIIKTIQKSE